MSVQYPGSSAALLGVIHCHRLDISLILLQIQRFTQGLSPRSELCLEFVWQLMIQINRKWMVHIQRQ